VPILPTYHRALSLFLYLKRAEWEKTYHPDWSNWTFAEYLERPGFEDNWMTRELSARPSGELTCKEFNRALRVLTEKALVGLVEHFDESVSRFEKYFGWEAKHSSSALEETPRNAHDAAKGDAELARQGTPDARSKAREKLKWDWQLYLRAKAMWELGAVSRGDSSAGESAGESPGEAGRRGLAS